MKSLGLGLLGVCFCVFIFFLIKDESLNSTEREPPTVQSSEDIAEREFQELMQSQNETEYIVRTDYKFDASGNIKAQGNNLYLIDRPFVIDSTGKANLKQ